MLCSARELGLSDDHAGLLVLPEDAPVGKDIREYLDLDDTILTLKLTPNRGDCLSMFGIARDIAALTGKATALPEAGAGRRDDRGCARDPHFRSRGLRPLLRARDSRHRRRREDAGVDAAAPGARGPAAAQPARGHHQLT